MVPRYPVPDLSPCPADFRPGDALPPECRFRREEEIRRSRFITSLGPAPDRESARRFIEAVRGEYPDATHHCWAYVAGAPGETAVVGQSDDGEPHGTAGRPMLAQLLRSGVGEVAAVVTRYFGGVKLGTGGLVRAYQGGVAQALQEAPVTEKVVPVVLDVVVDYARLNVIYRLAPEYQARIVSENFGQSARFRLEMPEDRRDGFCRAVVQATDGSASFPPPGP